MTIKQILDAEVGQKFGGIDVVIKTCKKLWQDTNCQWIQQVVLFDKTSDALADVKIGVYEPLQRNSIIHIIVAEVQEGVLETGSKTNKKIYIDQFSQLTDSITEPELGNISEIADKIVRSKIRCLLVAADRRERIEIDKDKIDEYKTEINYWVEFVFTGK